MSRLPIASILGLLALAACGPAESEDTGAGSGAATVAASDPSVLNGEYSGTIGIKKAMLRLTRAGTKITGRFFYVDEVGNGTVISLVSKGTDSLEATSAQRRVGTFALSVLDEEHVEGKWQPAGSGGPVALSFSAIAPGKMKLVSRRDTINGKCPLDATYFEVFGMADAAAEEAINKALLPTDSIQEYCQGQTTHVATKQTVTRNEGGLLVLSEDWKTPGVPLAPYAFNFSLKTGAEIRGEALFKPTALPQIKALIANLVGATGPDHDAIARALTSIPIDGIGAAVHADGLYIDMTGYLVTDVQAPQGLLPWADIVDLLQPVPEIMALANAGR